MYRFTSFDEDTFNEAIEEKNYSRLKTCIISSIRNNPGFKKAKGQDHCEARLAMNILWERAHDMFDKYEKQDGEHEYDEKEADSWDKEYFIRQTFLFGENFCWQRFNNLARIGHKITGGTNLNFQAPQELGQRELESIKIKENQTPQKVRPLLVTGGVILALIVLAAVLLAARGVILAVIVRAAALAVIK